MILVWLFLYGIILKFLLRYLNTGDSVYSCTIEREIFFCYVNDLWAMFTWVVINVREKKLKKYIFMDS